MAEALLRRRKSETIPIGTSWVYEIAADGTGASGTFEAPVAGLYEIEIHGGGGGAAHITYYDYIATGGGSGDKFELLLEKKENADYFIGTGGAAGTGTFSATGSQGSSSSFYAHTIAGGGGGYIANTALTAGEKSGALAQDGLTSKTTSAIKGGSGGSKLNYGDGGDFDGTSAKTGYNGAIIVTYKGKDKITLPSNYKRCNYIQSNGEEYIDTDFAANQNTRVVAIAKVDAELASDTLGTLFGSRYSLTNSAFAFFYNGSSSQWQADYSTNRNRQSFDATLENKINIDFNKNTLTANSSSYTWSETTFPNSCNLTLFALYTKNGNKISDNLIAKLYRCKIYDGDNLVRDFIPCINPDGEVGLYDLVSEAFFGNASGSGAFTAG